MTLTSENKLLAAVILLTLLIRTAVAVVLGSSLKADPDAYREIASNLLQHQTFGLDSIVHGCHPTAYRPPLYPCLLAACSIGDATVPPLRVAVLHILLGTATAAITFVVARQMALPAWQGVLAAMLVACDPILLNQSTLVMTETLATLLAVVALYCWLRLLAAPSIGRAAALGAVLGLAILCRPTFLPWTALLMGATLFNLRLPKQPPQWPIQLKHLSVALLTAAVALSPWVARNYLQCGHFILTTTHGGYTLWLANNIGFYRHLQEDRSGTRWDQMQDFSFQLDLLPLDPYSVPGLGSEIIHDKSRKQYAIETITEHRGMFLRACLYRSIQLWSPLPNKLTATESAGRRSLRYLTAAWYCGVYLLAFAGVASLRRRLLQPAWLAGVLLCVSFMIVHSIYWCNLRMRAPLMPVVALVAAAGAGAITARVGKGRFAATSA